MKIAALLLIGGTSQRFSNHEPKQFAQLGSKKVYEYALDSIQQFPFDQIVLVCHPNYIDQINHPNVTIVIGGKTRQLSVYNGLMALSNMDKVMIFEGARPFLDHRVIKQHFKKMKTFDAIATIVPTTDTLCKRTNTFEIPNRSQLYHLQMPQTFHYDLLLDAHKKALSSKKIDATEDCQLILPHPIEVVEGSKMHFKITTPFDFEMAKFYLEKKMIEPIQN